MFWEEPQEEWSKVQVFNYNSVTREQCVCACGDSVFVACVDMPAPANHTMMDEGERNPVAVTMTDTHTYTANIAVVNDMETLTWALISRFGCDRRRKKKRMRW